MRTSLTLATAGLFLTLAGCSSSTTTTPSGDAAPTATTAPSPTATTAVVPTLTGTTAAAAFAAAAHQGFTTSATLRSGAALPAGPLAGFLVCTQTPSPGTSGPGTDIKLTVADTAAGETCTGPTYSPKPPMHSSPAPEQTTAKPSAAASGCGVNRDIIVWEVTPTLPADAYVLGSYVAATCEPTAKMFQDTSPTGPGYCTIAAYASDNPGYDTDATPAKRPRKALVRVGPAC